MRNLFLILILLLTSINAHAITGAAISVDQAGWRVDANIGGANPSLGTSSITDYTEITDSSLDIVALTGSAAVEIPCSSTNPSTGLVCGAGNESVGVVFTPPTAGVYEACISFIHNTNLQASSTAQATFQLIETPNNAQTILQEGNHRQQSGVNIGATTINPEFPNTVCGVFTFSDASKRTIRLMREQATSGTVTAHALRADRAAANGQRDMKVTVRRRVEYSDAIKFTKLVTSPSYANGLKMETVQFGGASEKSNCTSTPCTIYRQSGGFSSITRSSTGRYIANISGGVFASTPTCNVTCGQTSVSATIASIDNMPSGSSTTTFNLSTINTANTFVDAACDLTCTGL